MTRDLSYDCERENRKVKIINGIEKNRNKTTQNKTEPESWNALNDDISTIRFVRQNHTEFVVVLQGACQSLVDY